MKVWQEVYPNKEFNPEIFDKYRATKKYLKQKEEIIQVDSILKEYMGENKVSDVYLNDLKNYNLLGGYFEITLKFYLTPLNELQSVSNIREYVLKYLKKLSRVNEIDNRYPQTIKDSIDYIIINFNKEGIQRIKDNEKLDSILNIIRTFFHRDKNSNLLYECFYSKYNIWGFKIFFDSFLARQIIFKELQEYICQNYEKILKLNLKDKIVEDRFSPYIIDEIDEFSLNYLNNLFSKEFSEILDYYNISKENQEELKNQMYNYCYEFKDYGSKEYRKFRILEILETHIDVKFAPYHKPLEKVNKYLDKSYLKELTKEEDVKYSLKGIFKYDIFCEIFFNELKKRDLIDYYEDMNLYNYWITLNSEEKIIKFIEVFEENHALPIPKSLMNAIKYLIENTSKEFINQVYNGLKVIWINYISH